MAQNRDTTVQYSARNGDGTITYTKDVTTIHRNDDGTYSNTTTLTTATFSTKEGQGGAFLSGTTQTSSKVVNNGEIVSSDSGKAASLSASGAMKAIGGPVYQSMQQTAAAIGSPGMLTMIGRDAARHPFQYVGHAAAIGGLAATGLGAPAAVALGLGTVSTAGYTTDAIQNWNSQ